MKKLLTWLGLILLLPVCISAEMSVVRVDGNKIYLDISEEKTVLTPGTTFKVIVSSETLTNPQTGKNLGEIYHYSEEGTITEVQPLYVIGEMKNAKEVAVGKRAVAGEVKTVASAPVVPTEQKKVSSRKMTTYQPVEQEIISLTQADVTAPGAQNIITLSDKNEITVFSRGEKETLKPEISYALPTGKKGLFVSAASVKEGLAQVFVAVYAESTQKISTLVLENQNGTLQQTENLQFFVKELGCGTDKKIWAQRPFVLSTAPGNAREVVFEKNKFIASKNSFNTRHNWLAGLNYYPVQTAKKENLINTAANGTLRMLLDNGKTAVSKPMFGSSPLRVSYKQDIVKFYPSVQVVGEPGKASLVAVENDTKLGLLSEMFGQYRAGKIHFLTYEKGSLTVADTVELDGVIFDTACTDKHILTADVLPDGTSRVVEILK